MKTKIMPAFKKAAKKLHQNQIVLVEDAIDKIVDDPKMGELKKGDLASIRVYKFYINHQMMLLAYFYDGDEQEVTLLSLAHMKIFIRT